MPQKPTVLLAEDDPNDQLLVQRALRKGNIAIDLKTVDNGLEAIEYLSGSNRFSDRAQYPVPALILLDLKMPYRTGLEVLEWIRHDSHCKLLPVIIISSSQLTSDINQAYELGVNAYLVKPAAFDDLIGMFTSATDLFIHKAARPGLLPGKCH